MPLKCPAITIYISNETYEFISPFTFTLKNRELCAAYTNATYEVAQEQSSGYAIMSQCINVLPLQETDKDIRTSISQIRVGKDVCL